MSMRTPGKIEQKDRYHLDNDHAETTSLDLDVAGSSTPLTKLQNNNVNVNSNSSALFMSPLRKLDQLQLESEDSPYYHDVLDRTIMEDSDHAEHLDNEYNDNKSDGSNETDQKPQYISRRKRQLETSDVEMATPMATNLDRDLKNENSSSTYGLSMSSNFDVSFSNSESTPCPLQPRKKLKFKNAVTEKTPTQRRTTRQGATLNIQKSIKKSVCSLAGLKNLSCTTSGISNANSDEKKQHSQIFESDDEPNKGDEESEDSIDFTKHSDTLNTTPFHPNVQSTPILETDRQEGSIGDSSFAYFEETGESINGYKFVTNQNYIFNTPEDKLSTSQKLKLNYNANDTNTRGDEGNIPRNNFSCNFMENNDDNDIPSKRQHDPYLQKPRSGKKSDHQYKEWVRLAYFELFNENDVSTVKLPLLEMFEKKLSNDQILDLINNETNVLEFYEYIRETTDLMDLVKKERIRWHPDKWMSKLNKISGGDFSLNKQIVNRLSQVLNNIIETHS